MTHENPGFLQDSSISYPARLVRRFVTGIMYDEGVLDLTALKVTQRGAGANFSVDTSLGQAVVLGDNTTNQGSYVIESTATDNNAIGAAPGSNSRIDLVVAQVNDTQAGGGAGLNWTIVVVPGTVAASPVAPATPLSAIALATVGPITSSTASITNAIITDVRVLAGDRLAAPGTMREYGGVRLPNGWLWADGSTVLRSTYPRLAATYADASYPYGAGDGSTTMALPDRRGRVSVGSDNMGLNGDASRLVGAGLTLRTIGGSGGAGTVALTTANLAAHSHTVNSHSHSGTTGLASNDHTHSGTTGGANSQHNHQLGALTDNEGAHNHGTEYAPNGQDEMLLRGNNTQAPKPLRGYYSATSFGTVTQPMYGRDMGTNTTANSATAHQHRIGGFGPPFSVTTQSDSPDHSHNITTGGMSAQHTHTVSAESPGTDVQGSGSTHANMQPSLVCNVIVRT